MMLPMIGGWFINALSDLFVGLLDLMAYNLLTIAYNVFDAVARLDLFGGGAAGEVLYNNVTKRLYMVLSIVMLFVFAYQLIMLIVDPDGKEKGASSKMVKDTLISLITVILLPTVFKYMSIFQTHIITEGTITSIILGTGPGNSQDPGKSVALMVDMAFYHPQCTTWTTFFDQQGNVRSDAETRCVNDTKNHLNDGGHKKTCKKYVAALNEWAKEGGNIHDITKVSKLRHYVSEDNDETMEYVWILSTAAGLLVAWTFFAYSIDVGTRAVKLGMLELIAPVPVILKIFPGSRKIFDTWFLEMRKTYLEIFIRLAIVFFGVEIIKLIPDFIEVIFEANTAGGTLTKCLATVMLILGILKFCQMAPELFKEIFSAGNNLFKGMNLSPRIRSHIEDNKLAMKGYGAAAGIAGGVANRAVNTFNNTFNNLGGGKNKSAGGKIGTGIAAAITAIGAAPRGIIAGAKAGWKNSPDKLTGAATSATAGHGISAAQESYDNRGHRRLRDNISHVAENIGSMKAGDINAKSIMANIFSRKEGVDSFANQAAIDWQNYRQDRANARADRHSEFMRNITGQAHYDQMNDALDKMIKSDDSLVKLAGKKIKDLNTEIEELEKEKRKCERDRDLTPTTDTAKREELDAKIQAAAASIKEKKEERTQVKAAAARENSEIAQDVVRGFADALKGGALGQQMEEALKNATHDLFAGADYKQFVRDLAEGRQEFSDENMKKFEALVGAAKTQQNVASVGASVSPKASSGSSSGGSSSGGGSKGGSSSGSSK